MGDSCRWLLHRLRGLHPKPAGKQACNRGMHMKTVCQPPHIPHIPPSCCQTACVIWEVISRPTHGLQSQRAAHPIKGRHAAAEALPQLCIGGVLLQAQLIGGNGLGVLLHEELQVPLAAVPLGKGGRQADALLRILHMVEL